MMFKKYFIGLLAAFCFCACNDGSTISTGSDTEDSGKNNGDKKDPEKQDPDKQDPDKQDPEKQDPEKPTPKPHPEIPDADGDTISDEYECPKGDTKTGEGCEDTDGDGTPDYQDTDSDDDTIPDSIEAMNGGDLSEKPVTCFGNSIEAFRTDDADLNEIPDAKEANIANDKPSDIDSDTIPDFCDEDNDDDTIPDVDEFVGLAGKEGASGMDCNNDTVPDAFGSLENPIDCDGDTILDYNDPDGDGDTIHDKFELTTDSNNDGILDRYSKDSDGDTIPDSEEKGPNETPLDSDGDGKYDFQVLDSDNDSLLDALEVKCSDGKDSRIKADTDEDGQSDLAEYAIAVANNADPAKLICDPSHTVKDYISFYFELPLSGETSTDTLIFEPRVTKADVLLNVDNTGSMQKAISNLQTHFTKVVVAEVQKRVPDSQFGVSIFRDFDATPVWQLYQPITSDLDAFQTQLNKIKDDKDATDYPEAGYESLYEIATGDVKNNDAWEIMPKPTGDDIFGSAGFRKGALPIVIHITDAPSHEKTNKGGHTAQQAFDALNEHGIRVIHIGTPFTVAENQPELLAIDGKKMAAGTHSIVPVCAHQSDSNTWACGTNKCCTNAFDKSKPAGEEPDSNSQCTLAINPSASTDKVMADGTDALAYKTMLAIEALVKYNTYDVATRIVGEPIPEADQVDGQNVDTSCFIQKVEAVGYEKPADPVVSSCLEQHISTKMKDFNSKGYMDGFENFAVGAASPESPKSKLSFKVIAQNKNCVKRDTKPRAFNAVIEVYNPATGMVFDKHIVAIIVPGVPDEQVN